MLHKTKGIVLGYIPYKETSIVVKIYTEKFGIQSYIENSVRKAKGKNKIALFQPLTLLDLVVYNNEKKDIQRISELKCPHPHQEIPYEITKTTIAIFINEVLTKTLKEEGENENLFFFLYQSILSFDELKTEVANFHLKFLIKLSNYLGFQATNAQEIRNQLYQAGMNIPLSETVYTHLGELLKSEFTNPLKINNETRSQLLKVLLAFYQLHIENFGKIKSTQVLSEVLA